LPFCGFWADTVSTDTISAANNEKLLFIKIFYITNSYLSALQLGARASSPASAAVAGEDARVPSFYAAKISNFYGLAKNGANKCGVLLTYSYL
jgi:hypothetical protein